MGKTFLLGVGAHKAGTTWLYEYLFQHPQVAMSPVKEMHFFGYRDCGAWEWPITHFRKKLKRRMAHDAETGRQRPYGPLRERIRMQGDIEKYRGFFRRRIGEAHVFGEITPAYCHLPAAEYAFINSYFKNTKVIYLMRNPADRHWSHMRFSAGAETVEELEAQVDETLGKLKYRERNDYASTLANLAQAFQPDQVHFEFYERLFTPEALERLCQFLNIDPMPAAFDRASNVSVKMPLSPELRAYIAAALKDQYLAVDTAFSGDVPDNWRADMAAF
ncbi:MAG: sulfotransferase domain-containing protein [Pseudomonadota bacterium]